MDSQQVELLVLSVAVFVGFTDNLIRTIRSERDEPRVAYRYRAILSALILWVLVASLVAQRFIATFIKDATVRMDVGLVEGSAIAGSLIIGVLWLEALWHLRR